MNDVVKTMKVIVLKLSVENCFSLIGPLGWNAIFLLALIHFFSSVLYIYIYIYKDNCPIISRSRVQLFHHSIISSALGIMQLAFNDIRLPI